MSRLSCSRDREAEESFFSARKTEKITKEILEVEKIIY